MDSQEKALGSPFPHAPNSFCVPDDDDDIIEIAYDSMPAKPVYNVDDSDIDSDNHHPAEHSTPLTSPSSHEKELVESKHEEKVEADKGSHDTPEDPQGSQKSPIVLDSEQLAVEPALSELINDCDSNNDDAEYDLYESENDIGSDSDNNGIELDSCDEDEQPAGDEDDSSSDQMSTHDSDRDDASMELSHVPITANYKPPYVEAEDDMEDGDIPSCVSEAGSIFDSRRKELLEHMVRFELNHEEQLAESRRKLRDHSPLKINDTRVPKHSTPPALPMLNERPGDLLVNYHKHGDRSAPSTAFYPPEYGISYLPVYENSYMPYQDGPFMMDQPNMQNNGSCAADFAEVASLNNHPKNPLDDQAQQSEKCAPDHHPSEKDLVDFFDWVEEKGSQKESLKRKADEMDKESPSDIPATSKSLPESVDDIDIDQPAVGSSEWLFFQDAQPKVPDGALKCSPSQLSDLQPIKDPQPTQDAPLSSHKDQPPRKRAKTGKKSRVEKKSRKGSIASYATTALVGAMVGGLGTIAALASLPPEYFQ